MLQAIQTTLSGKKSGKSDQISGMVKLFPNQTFPRLFCTRPNFTPTFLSQNKTFTRFFRPQPILSTDFFFTSTKFFQQRNLTLYNWNCDGTVDDGPCDASYEDKTRTEVIDE